MFQSKTVYGWKKHSSLVNGLKRLFTGPQTRTSFLLAGRSTWLRSWFDPQLDGFRSSPLLHQPTLPLFNWKVETNTLIIKSDESQYYEEKLKIHPTVILVHNQDKIKYYGTNRMFVEEVVMLAEKQPIVPFTLMDKGKLLFNNVISKYSWISKWWN